MAISVPRSPQEATATTSATNNSHGSGNGNGNGSGGVADSIWSSIRQLEATFLKEDDGSHDGSPSNGYPRSDVHGDAHGKQGSNVQSSLEQVMKAVFGTCGGASDIDDANCVGRSDAHTLSDSNHGDHDGGGNGSRGSPTKEVSFNGASNPLPVRLRQIGHRPQTPHMAATGEAAAAAGAAGRDPNQPYRNHRGVLVMPKVNVNVKVNVLTPNEASEAVYRNLLDSDQKKAKQVVNQLRQQHHQDAASKKRATPVRAILVPESAQEAKKLLDMQQQQQQQHTSRAASNVSPFFPVSTPKKPLTSTVAPTAAVTKLNTTATDTKPHTKTYNTNANVNVNVNGAASNAHANIDFTKSSSTLAASSFDDGVSCISQHTLDNMASLYERQPMQRVSSDRTHDPAAPPTGEAWKATLQRRRRFQNLKTNNAARRANAHRMATFVEAAQQSQRDIDAGSPAMSGAKSIGSIATKDKTIFSKSTVSTQTTHDFASAWKKDEAQYWQTVVEEEEEQAAVAADPGDDDTAAEETQTVGTNDASASGNNSTSSSKYQKFKKYRNMRRRASPNRSMKSKRDGTITTAGSSTAHTPTTRSAREAEEQNITRQEIEIRPQQPEPPKIQFLSQPFEANFPPTQEYAIPSHSRKNSKPISRRRPVEVAEI